MKTKFLFQGIVSVLLVVVVTSGFLATQSPPAQAKSFWATFTDCTSQTQIPAVECDALVALYNSTNGAGWTTQTDWLQTDTPCSWFGVTCNGGVNVTALDLRGNQLAGSLPAEIGNLTQLTRLYLDNNPLAGEIPVSFVNLSSLTNLTLSCGLTSSDPGVTSFIDGILGLGWDVGCPTTTPTPTKDFTSTATEIATPTETEAFTPTATEAATSTSTSILTSTVAETFTPTATETSAPTATETATPTQTLTPTITSTPTLCARQTQIPVKECEALAALYNSTDGANWEYADGWLYTNTPCGWYEVTCDNGHVTTLFLPGNQLSGSIPPELGNLTKLQELYLYQNQLTGSIPPELSNMASLTILELNQNQLIGSIPPQLGNMTNLTRLWLLDNRLTGSIPPELGNLTNLTDLALNFNQLSGPIPPELGKLTNLTGLSLWGNKLSGPLPAQIGNLTNLQYLYLEYNQLSGEIPASFVHLTSLYDLTLSCGLTSSNPVVIRFINRLIPNWQKNTCLSLVTLKSIAAQDGWVLESSETSSVGGSINSSATTFNLGDDAKRRQYLGILSFSTGASLPDNATILKVTLKLQKSAIVGGGNPVTIFGGFMVDVKNGFFGTAATLQPGDFQAAASKSYGPFNTALVGGWYTIDLTGAGAFVNKLATASGLTQIRLRFKLDDNNNTAANDLSLFNGNAPAASRPQLIVTYYVP